MINMMVELQLVLVMLATMVMLLMMMLCLELGGWKNPEFTNITKNNRNSQNKINNKIQHNCDS